MYTCGLYKYSLSLWISITLSLTIIRWPPYIHHTFWPVPSIFLKTCNVQVRKSSFIYPINERVYSISVHILHCTALKTTRREDTGRRTNLPSPYSFIDLNPALLVVKEVPSLRMYKQYSWTVPVVSFGPVCLRPVTVVHYLLCIYYVFSFIHDSIHSFIHSFRLVLLYILFSFV